MACRRDRCRRAAAEALHRRFYRGDEARGDRLPDDASKPMAARRRGRLSAADGIADERPHCAPHLLRQQLII